MGIEYKKVYWPRIRSKKLTLNVATNAKLRNILIKSMEIVVVAKNHLQPPKTIVLPQIILKTTI